MKCLPWVDRQKSRGWIRRRTFWGRHYPSFCKSSK